MQSANRLVGCNNFYIIPTFQFFQYFSQVLIFIYKTAVFPACIVCDIYLLPFVAFRYLLTRPDEHFLLLPMNGYTSFC